MSATIQGVDARSYLSGWLNALVGMYTADVNAIPEDKWNQSFGGCTRPASELTGDALSLLIWMTDALRGNVRTDTEEDVFESTKGLCQTRESSLATLNQVAGEFQTALMATSDEDLNKVITAPFGMDMPVFMLAQIAVSHLWYHDGQLNYIQCLLGDDKVHWMG
ncbi:MAG: DinB family protein [Chthonomonas sp.]|nr:DinB family protein [Chthonomonas sp.]